MNCNNYFGEEILLRVPSNRSLTNSKRIVVRYASSDSKIKKCICLENYQIYDIILKNQPVMMIYYIGGELHYIPYESGLKKLAVKKKYSISNTDVFFYKDCRLKFYVDY